MYQFMVATRNDTNVRVDNFTGTGLGTDVQDISTMSLTSGTNKWASRAVVALQLAAWSAVGIVLLEKGVASLQKRPETFNVSHEIIAGSTESGNVIIEKSTGIGNVSSGEMELGTDLFSVIPLVADKDNTGNTISNAPSSSTIGSDDKNNRSTARSNDDSMLKNMEKKVDREPERVRGPEEDTGWKGRKRSRFAKVGNGGAAAAVAMVVVGAVMLVLGPAVIVLRALDERRQERRFLKLSGEEDLPPSYEQATGNSDRAPTYSSLNLDTIVA